MVSRSTFATRPTIAFGWCGKSTRAIRWADQYNVGYAGSGTRVVIETAPHWELAITEIRCSNPWGALVAVYQEKPMQVVGEHIELLRPWRFREHLPVSFEYRPASRKIWSSKDGAPRSVMIVLSGLLIWSRL